MKINYRVIDYTAADSGVVSTGLPVTLICIYRALLIAEVPGIRCTNDLNGEQKFELADGTPLSLYLNEIIEKARRGEPLPTPGQVLTLFGLPCFSTLPCGAPVPISNGSSNTLSTSVTNEKA